MQRPFIQDKPAVGGLVESFLLSPQTGTQPLQTHCYQTFLTAALSQDVFGSQSKSWGWQLYLQSSSQPQPASGGLSGSNWPRQCFPCVSRWIQGQEEPLSSWGGNSCWLGQRELFFWLISVCSVLRAYFGIRGDKVFFFSTQTFFVLAAFPLFNFIYFNFRQSL